MLLIVENDPPTAIEYRRQLEALEYRVETARFGQDAILSLVKHTYIGVILNLNLPDMSGTEVIRRARKNTHIPAQIVVTTPWPADTQLVVEAQRIIKPAWLLPHPLTEEQIVGIFSKHTVDFKKFLS